MKCQLPGADYVSEDHSDDRYPSSSEPRVCTQLTAAGRPVYYSKLKCSTSTSQGVATKTASITNFTAEDLWPISSVEDERQLLSQPTKLVWLQIITFA